MARHAGKAGVAGGLPVAFSQKGLGTTVIPALVKRGLVAYDGAFNPNATRVRVTEAGASH